MRIGNRKLVLRSVAVLAAVLPIFGGMAAAQTGEAPPAAHFRMNGVDFRVPLSAGFCQPKGAYADVAQMVAAGDERNVTHLTLLACRDGVIEEGGDYILIKTPRSALLAQVDRKTFLKDIGAAFDAPEFATFVSSGKLFADVEDRVGKMLASRVKMQGNIVPIGRDDVCAYLGGAIEVRVAEAATPMLLGGCVTTIEQRAIMVAWYRRGQHAKDVASLLVKVREFVEAIDGTTD